MADMGRERLLGSGLSGSTAVGSHESVDLLLALGHDIVKAGGAQVLHDGGHDLVGGLGTGQQFALVALVDGHAVGQFILEVGGIQAEAQQDGGLGGLVQFLDFVVLVEVVLITGSDVYTAKLCSKVFFL